MRNLLRLLVAALVLTVFLPGTALAEEKRTNEKTAVRQRIDALAARDAAFAESEKAFTAAREAFLKLFTGDSRKWAENFLQHNGAVSLHEIDYSSRDDDYGQEERAKFMQRRAALTRYMSLAAKTPLTDPAFLILLRPVCLYATYHSGRDVVAQTLAEYDAYQADPYRDRENYVTRRVNGQLWAAILFPGTEIASSGSGDRNMAFIVRVADGSFALNPIIAPVTEDFYPGEQHPLRPEKYEYGPGNISINECAMQGVLTLTGETGPFAFRADAKQLFASPGLSYTCEPKCSGFTYTWNETAQSFIMADGICREDDGWKPKSPFDAKGNLLPVTGYIRTLADKNETVRNHEQAVEAALAAFLGSFEGAALDLVRSFTDGWLADRQFPLYRLIGDTNAFTAAYTKNDEPVLRYFRTVAELAKTPDARLTLLLEDPAARLALAAKNGAAKNGKENRNERRYPGAYDLLRGSAKPAWLVTYAREQNALLETPKQENRRYPYTATGLDGGETFVLTYDKPFLYRATDETPSNTYSMRKGSDGAFWGHALVVVGKSPEYDNAYENLLKTPRQYILRVADGKIAFVTPALPEEKDFFTNPEVDDWGKVLWKAPGEGRAAPLCEMEPAFTVDTATAPFVVTARDTALYADYYLCVPECSIPYRWDGNAYVRGAPECLPAGKWGAVENTHGRRR
ncbi:exported hypothetical protein [uncultured delta proteobacterium]|uniref:Uncharacterized protein n=1 Tax=uncultured delta proteobacterium TaxID=34034 RepID=A0A212K3K0_9DELT|nr:exported hypothetical protein [uncultured delta proteobacterium]